jgi:MFS family permease
MRSRTKRTGREENALRRMVMYANEPGAAAAEHARLNPGWLVVLAAFFGAMVSFGSLLVFTFGVFVKPLHAEFGWSREAISAGFGIAAMTVAAASPVLGRLLDRFGPRIVILPCMTIFGLSFASLGLLTPHLPHFYGTFLVLGAVGNGTTQMGYSRAVSSWFDRRRGLALALVMAGVGSGAMVFPPVAQALIDAYGWRAAYFVLGGVILLLGVPMTALFVREHPAAGIRTQAASAEAGVFEGVRSRPFAIIIATLVLVSVSTNGAIAHLMPMLTDRGVAAGAAAFAISALGLSSFAGRLATGALLDRFFGPKLAMYLFAVSAAGILLLTQAASSWMGVAAAVLVGVGVGAEADVTPYLLTRYFGLRSFSTLYGLTWTAYAVAGAAGPVMMGKVFDATGSYAALLSGLSVATLCAAVLMRMLPPYPRLSRVAAPAALARAEAQTASGTQ